MGINGVFIIESLDLEDEEKGLFEGKILMDMLKMLDVEVKYTYIRTKSELKVMIKKFEESNYKYLHLSCHGNDTGIAMTLNRFSFPFSEFNEMFKYFGKNKRLFLSSCSVMNGDSIINEMLDTQFLSITGPLNDINFNNALIFWASFYHLMFKKDQSFMDNSDMRNTINELATIFGVEMSTIIRKKNGKGYIRYNTIQSILEKTI